MSSTRRSPQRKLSRLDLIVAGSKDGIVMVEAGAKEVSEEEVIKALEVAHAAIKDICAAIDELAKQAGRTKLAEARVVNVDDDVPPGDREPRRSRALTEAMRIKGKLENYATVAKVEKETIAALPEDQAARKGEAKGILHGLQEKVLRDEILDRNVRLDGRKFDEIRPITIETKRAAPRARLRRCSPAAKPRPWSPPPSAPRTTSRRSRWSTARPGSGSCCTTTSRPSRSAK